MNDLEKHIRDKREELDGALPPEGHELRFLRKLEDSRPRRVNFRHALQIAASIAIILASAIVVIQRDRSGSKMAEIALPGTFEEANDFYASQVDQRVEEISSFHFESAEEKNILLEELQDLDARHKQLVADLEANPDDERVINAMIRHYQLKLEVMDQIIQQLNQFKTQMNTQNENEDV
jgi:hypothetical protein